MVKAAISLFLMLLISPLSSQADFPEIPFCPLGGPPGWFNRLKGDDRHHAYPPPVYYPQSGVRAWAPPPPRPYPPPVRYRTPRY